MMKENDILSLSRIKLLIKWDLAMNKKKYFWECAGMFVAYSFFLWIILLSVGQTHDVADFSPIAMFSVFLLFAMFAALNLADPIKDKKTRQAYLSLPASNGEKFLCRVLFIMVFFSVTSFGVFVLADVVQYVVRVLIDWFFPFIPYETSPTLVVTQIPLVFTDGFYAWGALTMYLGILSLHALALLGTFHRGIFTVALLFGPLRFGFDALNWLEKTYNEGGSTFLINSVLICLIAFCWWLAYRLFCRRQIV